MSGITTCLTTPQFSKSAPSRQGKWFFIFLLGLIFSFPSEVVGQDFPTYDHIDAIPLGEAGTSSIDNLIISIAADPKGYVYILTFGNGVHRYDPRTGVIEKGFIDGNLLDSPIDIAVSSQGKIFVADYLAHGVCSDNGKVKAFNSEGEYLSSETVLTGFYRPLGIVFDKEDNLYVAEYNQKSDTGCEKDEKSRVRIYKKNGSIVTNEKDFNKPFRIAVDSHKNVYVSQAGPPPAFPWSSKNGAIRILDSNLNLLDEWKIETPGSVIVDKEDFIYVVDYAGKINFQAFLQQDLFAIALMVPNIWNGIRDNEFKIRIFRRNGTGSEIIENGSNEIDLPLDIAFDVCTGNMYVNDAYVAPSTYTLQFNLEIFKRTPSLDTEDPVIACPEDPVTLVADSNGNYLLPNYSNLVSDNCDDDPEITQFPEPGEQVSGTVEVKMTAEDEAGNDFTCTFHVIAPEEEVPPSFSCPDEDYITDLSVDADCGYEGSDFTTHFSNFQNFANDPYFAQEISRDENILRVKINVYDGEGGDFVDTCSFEVVLNDLIDPSVLGCPTPDPVILAPGESYNLPNFIPNISATDNCDDDLEIVQDPPENTLITGNTQVTITATDDAGNEDSCTFMVTVEEEVPPSFSCPDEDEIADLTLDADCGYEESDFTIHLSNFQNFANNPYFAQEISRVENILRVEINVYDGEGGEVVGECTFEVELSDELKPTIDCPTSMVTISRSSEGKYILPDYGSLAEDNCDDDLIITQSPLPGEITSNTTVTLTARDDAGNISETCSFSVELAEEPEPSFTCPEEADIASLPLDSNCNYEEPDYRDLITGFENFENTPALEQSTSRNGEILNIIIIVRDGEGGEVVGECTFEVELSDELKPTIDCPTSMVTISRNSEGKYILPDYGSLAEDNCDNVLAVTQAPLPGEITSNTTVTLTARDDAGNISDTCSFSVELTEDPVPTFTCLGEGDIPNLELDANCSFEEPDYRNFVSNFENFNNEPYIVSTTTIEDNILKVNIQILDGENGLVAGECNLKFYLLDNTAPIIDCPSSIIEITPNSQGKYILPDYGYLATDNCDETLVITQNPLPGEITSNATVVMAAHDSAGNTSNTCIFSVVLVSTAEELEITCPQPQSRSKNENCEAVVPDFTGEVTANKEATFSQSPLAGSIISEATTITITATAGSETKQCSFLLTITDNSPLSFSCPEDQTKTYDPATGFALPDYTGQINATDNCGIKAIVQDPAPGTVIHDDQLVMLYVWDTSDMLSNCSFTVTLSEEEVLDITCPGDLEANLDSNCSFEVPDYRNSAIVNFVGAQIVQEPAPGTIITENTSITFTATLGEETDFCSFELTVSDYQDPKFTCVPDQNITFDSEEGFVLPDYREEANPTDNCTFEWVQTPVPGTIINHNQIVELVATDVSGNRSWCSFTVWLTEEEPEELQITCPEAQTGELDANCGYLVQDFRSLATVNIPGAVVTQDPPAGTTINSSTSISLIATSGNQTVNCTFQLTLEDVTAPTVVCPPDQWENYDPATDFPLPDYRDLAVTSDACGIAQVQQSPAPGTNITQNTTVSLSVTDLSGNSITCAFTVNLTQDEVVEITCPGNQEVQPSENCSFTLADYTGNAGVNFEGAQVTQAPAPGTQITGNVTIILTATLNGQTDSCAFDVVSVDNTAPVAKCILTGGYRLNQNGTLTLDPAQIDNGSSDNCGIVNMEISRRTFTTADIGDHNITLTVTDAAGNSDSCQTSISIWPYIDTGNDFACKTSVVLELDETGNAILTPQDLYTGDPQERIFNISKTNFSCSNLGDNYINFTYQGSIDSGTCEIKVEVQDNLSPIVQIHNITVFLNEAGRAEITPAAINNGTTDNCGTVNYSLDITSFSCKDIGENQVRLTAVDASGNSSSATAMVTVTGTCDEEPPPPGGNGPDDIFIYPNPTPGPFTIATPSGQKITRVEIFDFRGRFLLSKDFAEDVTTYTLDITGVEQAVYVLNIQTSDGRKIRRVIKY